VTEEPVPPAAPLPAATAPRRTHPATPWVNVAQLVPAAAVLSFVLVSDGALDAALDALGVSGAVLTVAVGALLLLSVGAAGTWLVWSRFTYSFDEAGDLRVDAGVLTRRERRLQLSRLQSVDVEQPLVARLVGLAEVRVEVAGAGDSRVTLRFLREADAWDLRAEVLARAAGLRPDSGQAPEQPLTRVHTSDLVVSLLLSSTTLIGLVATGLLIVFVVLTQEWVTLLALLPLVGVPLISITSEFLKYFDFTVAESPDGIRLRSGLTTRQSQTVPPGRVHAVRISQPLLWRRRGWVRLKVIVAGAPGAEQELSTGVLIPVAGRELAQALVDRVLPGLDIAGLEWAPAPGRARWRAPWQWRQLAVAADRAVIATRGGRFVGVVNVVPHSRVQSVSLLQGPLQRRLALATLRVDVAPGPFGVAAAHLDTEEARGWLDTEAETARRSRRSAGPERWMSR
jgi:putative membrane protein